jgi:hypothetical protein
MKSILKLMVYSAIVVCLCVSVTVLFKSHPEVQLAFVLPGIFIFIYSKIKDEVYVSLPTRLRIARGK